MPMSPQEFYAHAMRAADAEGRLPLSRMAGWEVFPFEPEGLRVVPLAPPELPEPPRAGENPLDCGTCRGGEGGRAPVWSDEHWRLSALGESGAPLILLLKTTAHYDLPDLPDARAAELGLLVVRIARAIEALPHIARAHVSRWGDGGAHLHLFFFARPAGFAQLRGTCLAIWDDLLPAVPDSQRDEDAAAVGAAVAAACAGNDHRNREGERP
jgi:diadenosine tetraphosphate (Ap4A) HIT family hydrolase